jgi:multidrug efflux system membrane fusion protein
MNDTSASTPGQSRRGRRMIRSVAIVVAVLGVIAASAWYLSQRNARSPRPGFGGRGRAVATVALASASVADIPIKLEALGTVTPLATATVRPQVSGVLSEIFYREGDNVKRGAALAQIDPRPFQLALEQSQGQLDRDDAQLANANVVLERDRRLLGQKLIAQQDVDTQAATVKQLEGLVSSDHAAVSTARLNLSYSRITAPIDGRVGLRPVDVGNYVTPADAAGIATLTEIAPIDVLFTLPADTVTRIEQRLHEGAELPTTVLDRTRTIALGRGTFLTLDNRIDSQTGTIRAKARFGNDDGALFPNQFVNVQLTLDVVHDAVTIPAAALRHGPQGDYVYVVAEDRTAQIRPVTVGPAAEDQMSITQGLAPGERVVTEGGDRLTDGTRVRLADASQAEPADESAARRNRARATKPEG